MSAKKSATTAAPAENDQVQQAQVEDKSPELDQAQEQTEAASATSSTVSTKVGEVDVKALLEAGVHFGHQTQRWNPRMRKYIYTERDGIHIFDLIQTAQKLQEAMDLARKLGREGKTLVFVGTKRQAQDIVKSQATNAGAMYIVTRWLGGFLTNWDQVKKSIESMNRTYQGLEEGRFDKYTKFEQVQMRKEADRKARFLEGVKELKARPDALFIADLTQDLVVAKEAKMTDTPVIAIVDSNADPNLCTHPIPGNDDAVSSIEILTSLVAAAYAEGKQARTRAK